MSSIIGKLIVIEGLEGAGKSTAVTAVVDFLTSLKINTLTVREPGGTPIGEALRTLIKDSNHKNSLHDKSELLLFYAARIQLFEQVIKPALEQGIWVIADRFELSTLAYQGAGRGIKREMIQHLSHFALNGFKPSLTLYLDINPEQGMQRVKSRGECDRIEQQSIDFFHRVHQCYLQYAEDNSDVVLIDANKSLPEVVGSIQKALSEFIEHKA